MPKSDKHSTLARQWHMLKLIPTRKPGLTTRELRDALEQEGFPVTLRTVERDLDSLSELFHYADVADESTRAKRWYYTTGKAPDIGNIDLIEAVSLALAGDVLERVLPGVLLQFVTGKIQKARSKLKAMDKVPLARWSEKVRYVHGSIELLPPTIQPRLMEAIQSALIDGKQVEVASDAFQRVYGIDMKKIGAANRSYLDVIKVN